MSTYKQQPSPSFTKTGTTIAALKFNKGVIILADTRSTSGPFVANKHIHKISKITNNIYTAGAGTAADTFRVCKEFGAKLRVYQKKFSRVPSLEHFRTIVTNYLHSYGGYVSAALICGGVDEDGPKIISIQPHGSSNSVDYAVNGSGCYAAMGVLEALYNKNLNTINNKNISNLNNNSNTNNLEKSEALQIGIKTIEAGVKNDLYSGTGVDYVIVYYKSCIENEMCLKKECSDSDRCDIFVESDRVELDLGNNNNDDTNSNNYSNTNIINNDEEKKNFKIDKFKKESLVILKEEIFKY